ncbi:spindle and kinetochore-associated protein 3 isoform X3 [Oryctolagus cuniculus]|uniref:spindle and kinetochore-associated protein 3 isoform X3 n=1 Tax=Oryctolagus cuniculus TaxID=9986 RepID=UPI0038799DBF
MDPIRSFCGKLRSLASTLDCETARLQRALDGEDSDFEDYPMRILNGLHSEVQTLKDDVSILLDKARLENEESMSFIKTTKVMMKKNSVDIMQIKEFFQKYGYNPRVKKNSVCEQDGADSATELPQCDSFQKPDGDLSDPPVPSSSVSEKPPRSPQLSDFGLERYMISQSLPNPPQAVNQHKEEPKIVTPPGSQSVIKVLKTPKCALKMDDFECVTPKLEHFGISEYTMCLNEDYTMGLKNMKNNKREKTSETEHTSSDKLFATPGPVIQQLQKSDTEYTKSPLAPTFCTPGLKIPATKKSTALVSTNFPLSKTNKSSNDLEVTDCTTLVLNSDKCFENFADPSSPTISSYENLLRTPTPPEVTTIPEDILQVFFQLFFLIFFPKLITYILKTYDWLVPRLTRLILHLWRQHTGF